MDKNKKTIIAIAIIIIIGIGGFIFYISPLSSYYTDNDMYNKDFESGMKTNTTIYNIDAYNLDSLALYLENSINQKIIEKHETVDYYAYYIYHKETSPEKTSNIYIIIVDKHTGEVSMNSMSNIIFNSPS